MHYINKKNLVKQNKFTKKLYLFYAFLNKLKQNKLNFKIKNLQKKFVLFINWQKFVLQKQKKIKNWKN